MNNLMLDCALTALGVSRNTIVRLTAKQCHFYEIINDQNVPLLWEELSPRKSQKAIQELQTAQRTWQQDPSWQNLIDSVWFLKLSGLDEKLIKNLRRNGIESIATIRARLANGEAMPPVWNRNPRRNTASVQTHANWKTFNRVLIEREFTTKPAVDLSERLATKHAAQTKQTHLIKWLGIETIPTTLMAFLKTDFHKKTILVDRLAGKTLQEIGDQQNLTRERVRQIVANFTKKLPLFDDVEKYRELVVNYDISLEDFGHYTQAPREIYHYILVKYKRNKDLKSLDQYLLALEKVSPAELTEKLNLAHKFISHENQINELTASNVIAELLFNHQHEVFNGTTLMAQLAQFYQEHAQSEVPNLSVRAIDAQMDRLPHVIKRTNGYFRYYRPELADVLDYLDDLNEGFNVPDGIYGIQYFFELNRPLMAEIDIQEGTELANLLKTIGYQHFPRLNTIVRQSQVYIGKTTHDAQSKQRFYLNVLAQFDGRSVDEVATYLQKNFNFNHATVLVYLTKEYAKYLHDNQIMMNAKLPTAPEFYARVQALLGKALYTYEQVTNLIKSIDSAVQISPVLLDKLGYVERSGLLMQKSCESLDDALRKLWLTQDYVSTYAITAYHNRWFSFKAYHFELQHDLVAVDDERYMTSTKLNALGVTNPAIDAFLREVQEFLVDDVFFTWKSLRDAGFDSQFIHDHPFDDYVYERLIFTMPSIRTIKTKGNIFINESDPQPKCPPLTAFLAQELGATARDLDEFLAAMKQKFGLDLERFRVVDKINRSEMGYSAETKRIYPNKAMMYADIYQDVALEVAD